MLHQFKALVTQTHAYLHEIPKQIKADQRLSDGNHDGAGLSGSDRTSHQEDHHVTQEMEQQLLHVAGRKRTSIRQAELNAGLLNGPVINARDVPMW